jgi:hypothetical protein
MPVMAVTAAEVVAFVFARMQLRGRELPLNFFTLGLLSRLRWRSCRSTSRCARRA